MAIYCRDMVYDVMVDHEFHPIDDLRPRHPQWDLGLRLLLKWGCTFERQGDTLRMNPGLATNGIEKERSREAVESFIRMTSSDDPAARAEPSEPVHPRLPPIGHRFQPRPKSVRQIPTTTEESKGEVERIDPKARLHIASGFYLDTNYTTETAAVLARKGSGKSYFAMVVAEEFARTNLPFLAIDPTGAWWGLRSGKDGKAEHGYPIPIIGGEHGDMPVTARMGGLVADYVVEHNPSQIIVDLSLLTSDEQHFFAYRFFRNLFQKNRKAFHVFVDEADEFTSQFPRSMAEQLVLGQVDRAVRRGRIKGIGMTLITQRSAVLNKNVLTQVGKLYVLHTAGPQDLKAIEGWAKNYLEPEVVEGLLKSLPRLPRGVLYHVTGEGTRPERYEVRAKRTWDSSKTPKVGEEIVVPPLHAADIEPIKSFIEAGLVDVQAVEGEVEAPANLTIGGCDDGSESDGAGAGAGALAKRPRKRAVCKKG